MGAYSKGKKAFVDEGDENLIKELSESFISWEKVSVGGNITGENYIWITCDDIKDLSNIRMFYKSLRLQKNLKRSGKV